MQERNKVVVNNCFGGFGLSAQAAEYLNEKYDLGIEVYAGCAYPDLTRHDPRLVEVVEVLGKEANATFAKLGIVEIKGNRYRIDEYDGSESVITPEEQDWITI